MTDTCVRRAWLTLGGLSVDLEDVSAGYFCSSLDLGYPDVRDVTSNRPDADGIDDRTALMGGRVISADITALRGAGAVIDVVAASFAPFMVPSARPTLHYILDRLDNPERTLTVRPSGYSWQVAGPDQRDINLQWVAADPVARAVTEQTATSWSGSSTLPGRTYPLTFNRIYPPGGSVGNSAQIRTAGEVPIKPRLRIFGPITNPNVFFYIYPTGTGPPLPTPLSIRFTGGIIVGAGHFVEVDVARKTAFVDADPTQSVLASIDWINTTWPVLPILPGYSLMTLSGNSTSGITQCQATWRDGFLS
jgi:hypothetical protein